MEKLRSEVSSEYKWNLCDLIKDENEYQNICADIKNLCEKIYNMKGSITTSSDNLLCFLENNTLLNQKLELIYVYSFLYHYQDMKDEKGLNYKSIAEKLIEEENVKLSFINSELLSIDYEIIKKYIKENEKLRKYAFSLEKTFRYQKYVLSEKEEKIIAEASNAFGTAHDAFESLDNVDIDLGYIKDENGKKVLLTQANYIKFLNSKDRNVRKNAFKKMYAYFANHINTLSATYLGNIKENYFGTNVRGYKNPLEKSLYNDKIEEEFYHWFINEIHKYLPLMYKYTRIRNKALGYKNHLYDIFVDLALDEEKEIKYENGIEILQDALKPLGEQYLKDLKQAFSDGWIDVYPNKYKRSGAYQWGVYGTHPYVSVNYIDNFDSVSTLAHELGHAMHSYYSDKSQEYNDAAYPIFLAEIASTVNEVLVDDYFYRHAKSDEEKIKYLQNFLDKVRTTIFRQTMFAEFEMIMHQKYSDGIAITANELCNTYYDLNKLYFGKSIVIDEEIKYEWARIPHFYTPFYVYKYATGLISALSIAYDILNRADNAQENYLNFLSSGGSDYPMEVLKKANVDIRDPKTIKKAFDLYEEKLKQLEELIVRKVNNE